MGKMLLMKLLLLVIVGWSQGQDVALECSDSEMQEIQAQFNQCAVQLEYSFEERQGDSKDAIDDETAGCTLVTSTVVECGKAWAKCYTEEEVQRLGDMHIESLLAQHSSLSLARCSLVEEYLLSGRREENVEQEDRCSDRRSIQAQQKFQACSHTESTKAYDKIIKMEKSEKIKEMLCETLGRIGSVCTEELEECFSPEDLVRTARSHLIEMQKFLVSFAAGRIGEDDLIGCGEVEVEDEEKYKVYDVEESQAVHTDIIVRDTVKTSSIDIIDTESNSKLKSVDNDNNPSKEMTGHVEPLKSSAVHTQAEQKTQKQNNFKGFHKSSACSRISVSNISILIFVALMCSTYL